MQIRTSSRAVFAAAGGTWTGVVVRCRVCHDIVMVLVEVRGMVCVDLSGLSELERRAGRH